MCFTLPPIRRSRAAPDPGGSRSIEPSGATPHTERFLLACGESQSTSDAHITARVHRSARSPPELPSSISRQRHRFMVARGAFHRRVSTRPLLAQRPRTWTRHRSADFAIRTRLPTLFRSARPLAWGAELDQPASARYSRACAFGPAPLVDFCHQHETQARPTDSEYPVRLGRSSCDDWLHLAGAHVACRACFRVSGCALDRAQPRVRRVRGPDLLRSLRISAGIFAPRWLATEASPQPDFARTPPVTQHASLTAGVAERTSRVGPRAQERIPVLAPNRDPHLRESSDSSRAASLTPPRRDVNFAAPEVPSVA